MVLQAMYFFLATAFLQAVVVSGDNCTHENLGIIGGHKVTIQDAPFMVALYYSESSANDTSFNKSSTYESSVNGYAAFCGGSIIHERFILTAAHCPYFVNIFYGFPAKRALIGSDSLNAGGMFIDVEEEFCHESFGDNNLQDDICLLKLKEPVPFGCKVAKVELPDEEFELEEGTLVNVTGFGDLGNNAGMANELRQTTIPIVSDECCLELYNEVNVTQFCAGSHGHDSCMGDSGGPLTYNNVQIGVVSYGEYCRFSTAGVYTKVSSYLDWIKTIIKENE